MMLASMKNLTPVVVAVAALGLASQGHAELLANGSFEDPGAGKIQNDWTLIPGWSSDSVPVDSGVEEHGSRPTDGTYYSFLFAGDSSVWQATSHTIAADELFTLVFDARDVSADWDLTYSIFATTDGGATRTTLDSGFLADEQTDGVTLVVNSNDHLAHVGSQIGVEFDNATDYAGLDSVSLTVGPIPEPGSLALLALGGVALFRRRR